MEKNINAEKKARIIGLFVIYIVVILVFWMEYYFEYGLKFNPDGSMFHDFLRSLNGPLNSYEVQLSFNYRDPDQRNIFFDFLSSFYQTLDNFSINSSTTSRLCALIALILPWSFRYKIGRLIELFVKKI